MTEELPILWIVASAQEAEARNDKMTSRVRFIGPFSMTLGLRIRGFVEEVPPELAARDDYQLWLDSAVRTRVVP